MITGKENILEGFRLNKAIYFKIKKTKESAVMYHNGDEAKSTNDGLNDLSNILDLLSAGNYYLEFWSGDYKDGKAHMAFPFAINTNSGTAPQIGAVPTVDVQSEIDKAINAYIQKNELEKLKAENLELNKTIKELEREQDSFSTKFMNTIQPYIGMVLPNLIPGSSTATAVGSVPLDLNELEQRLSTAFETWDETQEDQLLLIEGIVKLQKNNIDTYNMAKNFILQK